MSRKKSEVGEREALLKFNRYLVFYGTDESGTGLKGIRSDAPPDVIDVFIDWYRQNNRYENGRLRPENIVRKTMIIDVSKITVTDKPESNAGESPLPLPTPIELFNYA